MTPEQIEHRRQLIERLRNLWPDHEWNFADVGMVRRDGTSCGCALTVAYRLWLEKAEYDCIGPVSNDIWGVYDFSSEPSRYYKVFTKDVTPQMVADALEKEMEDE